MITGSSNRQIKNIIALQKKSKERAARGLFVIEGKKMFAEAPRAWLEKVYVSETFRKEPQNTALLAEVDYEEVSDSVFSMISDTKTPQGILALLHIPHYRREQLLSGNRPGLLLLENIQDPGNLGTMFRTAEAAGMAGIIMTGMTVDLFSPKTIRSTMGSIFRVPYEITEDLEQTILALKREGILLCAAGLSGQALDYDAPDYVHEGGTAFLIGNEGNGLSDKVAAMADLYVKIPMEGQVESLNAAVAASILMYELHRQRKRYGD